jgi:hypothetical protein
VRKSFLTTAEFALLNDACVPVTAAFGGPPYLVGSVNETPEYRDVDLRVILDDDEFDHLFDGKILLWSLVCQAIGHYLRNVTGLPIDFQIQRMSQANVKFPDGPRNPMGFSSRPYAGGGDATPF